VRSLLTEHNKKLDENKLRKLHQKHWHLFNTQDNSTKSNWILNDKTTLTTTIKETNGGYGWDIFVSEGIKYNDEKENFRL
jgi:hypothetical protein